MSHSGDRTEIGGQRLLRGKLIAMIKEIEGPVELEARALNEAFLGRRTPIMAGESRPSKVRCPGSSTAFGREERGGHILTAVEAVMPLSHQMLEACPHGRGRSLRRRKGKDTWEEGERPGEIQRREAGRFQHGRETDEK